ncbi:MAG: 7-cyano-7-deazaguanine synthase [Candidatus Peribacteraceae bacterium]|nr:7-cyano-7-deazaguanine synthase [Candidatus Peribacteraceae bacterium]
MCGISAYFATESTPHPDVLKILEHYGRQRGTDAIGYCIIDTQSGNLIDSHHTVKILKGAELMRTAGVTQNDILLMNHRARPEMESESIGSDSIQPIMYEDEGLYLIHNGSVSNFIYNELKEKYVPRTKLDSEAIIWAYLEHGRNMETAMKYLSGGFSFLLVDTRRKKLIAVNTHNPMYCGYVCGHGLFFSSMADATYDIISRLKGFDVRHMNMNRWEDYYMRELPANTIVEFDMQSTMINEFSFEPRYIHPNRDPYLIESSGKKKVLVSASGGLDSSTTLVVLKEAGYDITAVHFKYGHRGQQAEEIAITNITKELDIPLVTFDIEANMKILDSNSMLTNRDVEITTGTAEGLKTTVAWTCFRNGLFVSYLAALAESFIINEKYDEVLYTGGFMNLTESGVYPDNSERFINAFSKAIKFGSIAGTRIKPMYGLCNLLKTEQYVLLQRLGYMELTKHMISCDRPHVIQGVPHNCCIVPNGDYRKLDELVPACGSGLLSYWSSKIAGVKDHRTYYEISEDYKPFEPNSDLLPQMFSIEVITSKIMIHEENKKKLMEVIGGLASQID